MPAYNEVGFAKNEMLDIKDALEYTVANDTTLTQSTIDRMNDVAEIFKDMRQQIIDYETENTVTVDPASILRAAVNAF